MMDMAHISGLVATGNARSPFDFCDIVTTTTHKSLRGPRSGMIFYRLDDRNFETKINMAVFPGLQGGPHLHQIGGLAVQLNEVQSPAFKKYAKQVISNCQALGNELTSLGYKMCSGGSDNHLQLWDLRRKYIYISKQEYSKNIFPLLIFLLTDNNYFYFLFYSVLNQLHFFLFFYYSLWYYRF